MKQFRFTHPDGRVMVVTQDPSEPTKYSTAFEDDGSHICSNVAASLAVVKK